LLSKPNQLRVMDVTASLAPQDLLRQQTLPPDRQQSFRVEIFGMQRPEAHGNLFLPQPLDPRQAMGTAPLVQRYADGLGV
jgi:hypothetical protein